MKKKIKNIIILIIIIILVIISVAFIKNRILLYNVKNNYFKALLDLKRSGNFHIIVNVKYAEREYDSKTEFIVKDGVEVRNDFSEDSDNYDCSIDMNENILINHNAKNYYKLTDREQSGYTGFGNAKFDPSFCLNNYQNANIKNVKYGSYKGKDCYILENIIDFETEKIKQTVYIDRENYLPVFIVNDVSNIEYSNGYGTETEYILISVGTVTELPKFNLDEYTEIKNNQ